MPAAAPAGARRTGRAGRDPRSLRAVPLERPNRSEIFGPERFAQHGRSLGETHARRDAQARARARSFRACATTSASCARRSATSAAQATHRLRRQPGGRVAARQLPPDRGAAARDPRRPAAPLLPRPAGAARRAAGRPAARLRRGLGLRRPHRQRLRRGAARPFPAGLPGDARAHAGRAVGAADHAARGADREPAPAGRARCAANKAAREVANLCGDRIEA